MMSKLNETKISRSWIGINVHTGIPTDYPCLKSDSNKTWDSRALRAPWDSLHLFDYTFKITWVQLCCVVEEVLSLRLCIVMPWHPVSYFYGWLSISLVCLGGSKELVWWETMQEYGINKNDHSWNCCKRNINPTSKRCRVSCACVVSILCSQRKCMEWKGKREARLWL